MSDTQVKYADAIHHVLFPTSNIERTADWYSKVLGLKHVNLAGLKKMSELTILIMSNGNFDIHFTPVDEPTSLDPYHFAIEIADWDEFIAHLDGLGIEYGEIQHRPQNNSKTSSLRDPDGHRVEFVWHGNWHTSSEGK